MTLERNQCCRGGTARLGLNENALEALSENKCSSINHCIAGSISSGTNLLFSYLADTFLAMDLKVVS